VEGEFPGSKDGKLQQHYGSNGIALLAAVSYCCSIGNDFQQLSPRIAERTMLHTTNQLEQMMQCQEQ